MPQVGNPDFDTLDALEAYFLPWAEKVMAQWNAHVALVNRPREREAARWQEEKYRADEAMAWASSVIADAEDYELQALGLVCSENPKLTVAQAKKKCHQMISVHTNIRHLERAANSRVMSVQGDLKTFSR